MDFNCRLLVIDQVPRDRLLPGLILRPYGCEVEEAIQWENAVFKIHTFQPHIVLVHSSDLVNIAKVHGSSPAAGEAATRPLYVACLDPQESEVGLDLCLCDRVYVKPFQSLSLLNLVSDCMANPSLAFEQAHGNLAEF